VNSPRGQVRPDLVYIGWQPAGVTDPGPPPRPPAAIRPDVLSQDWVAAQRREHRRLAGPARRTTAAGLALAALAAAGNGAGLIAAPLAVTAGAAAVLATAACAGRLWRDSRCLAAQLATERERVARFGVVQADQLRARQQEHGRQLRDWQRRRAERGRQPHWHPVTIPAAVHRLDVAGGTLAGWSALLTMIAAPRLAAGGEVHVLDLTEGGIATDLLAVARRCGIGPRVWVLPADLPRLGPGAGLGLSPGSWPGAGAGLAGLGPGLHADLIAQTVAAADGPARPAGADPASDAALLSRVLAVLGEPATMAQLLAALRVLGQIGPPGQHLGPDGLTPGQLASLTAMAGRGAERLVIDRCWAMEARLRALAALGTAPASLPRSALQVSWLDRRGAAVGNAAIAAYLAAALTAALRQAPPARPWQLTVCLLGAERLPGDILDRLSDAAETAGAGLVLAYRSIPAHVRERLGRGHAALAVMRLGNADDAKVAAEQIGTEHRFVLSQLTESVGRSVTDTAGDSYTSTAGTADSVAGSASVTLTSGRSRGQGSSRQGPAAPFGDVTGSASRDANWSAASSDSVSMTEGINTGTSWGWTTSAAIGTSDSLAATAQRCREFLAEQHELQQLPHTAVLLCYPAPGGRQVVLADANPAIMALPTATLADARP
jgi:hypothetical protein